MAVKSETRKTGYSAPTGLDLEKINPALHGKYSPNLFAFLSARKNASQLRLARVFVDQEGVDYLGFMDDTGCLIGARLSQVLCYGVKTNVFSFTGAFKWKERTGFWDDYIADGRCAVDRDHTMPFIGSEHRWRVAGDHRDCQWCGKASQQLQREVKQVVVESWHAAASK